MAATEEKLEGRRVFALLAVLVISAMMILNETTVSVALPAVMADFGVPADVVQWLLTGFLLTMAVVIPTTGFLIQRFSVAPALGPTIAGAILQNFTWHHIFWIMVPIPVLAVITAVFVIRQLRLGRRGRALLDFSAFRHRNFTFSVITVFCAMAMMLGTVSTMPIYLQVGLGVSAIVTGLAMLPGGLLQGVASPNIGRVYDSVGPKPLAVSGALIMLLSSWWLSFTVTEHTAVGLVIVIIMVFNLGMALVMTPLMTVSLSSLPMSLYSHGSAIMNALQQLGGAAGTAVLVAVVFVSAIRPGVDTVEEQEP
ncbi:MFS transporter [Corynebacterium frankenforstense]|uniref:MFS transporter n=1 Tax=Corynebacterium frankenforstense TaxID=1230998 RepID=UPI00254F19A8|nr:MFS transporter [Corynebacterium frankenforstense]MDK6260006.1 MFS transporter [Corynebacterium frankenforstense]